LLRVCKGRLSIRGGEKGGDRKIYSVRAEEDLLLKGQLYAAGKMGGNIASVG
jgi:hypothetical protein